MAEKQYRVIRPYQVEFYSPPVMLPVGTVVRWWPEREFYLSEAVNGVCFAVAKWPVEAWRDYFEPVEQEAK